MFKFIPPISLCHSCFPNNSKTHARTDRRKHISTTRSEKKKKPHTYSGWKRAAKVNPDLQVVVEDIETIVEPDYGDAGEDECDGAEEKECDDAGEKKETDRTFD